MRKWIILVLLLNACGEHPGAELLASGVNITSPIPGQRVSAGYMTLTNNTNSEIRITDVSSEDFDTVAMHESIFENGIASMRPIEELLIAANSSTVMAPGGMHLMLLGPRNSNSVTLNFHNEVRLLLTITIPVSRKDSR